MSNETINLIINGLTAFGTVGSVVLSLYFWYKSNTISAKARICFSTINGPDGSEEVVEVSITNYGSKSFSINGIFGRDRKESLNFYIRPYYGHPYCKISGEHIIESETANYIFPKEKFVSSSMELLKLDQLSTNAIQKKILKIKYLAVTNLGKNIDIEKSDNFDATFLVEIGKLAAKSSL